jgi:PAS domain S-box-containing protein
LTSAITANRRSLSLAQQGLLLVAIFLLYEVGFIGALAWLLSQAEAEGARQEYAREINAKADRLSLIVYDKGDSVGRYARSLSTDQSNTASSSVDEIPGLIAWLKEAFKDKPEARALVERIEQEIAIAQSKSTDIQSSMANNNQPQAQQEWNQKREAIQPVVNQLLRDLPALMVMTKIVESGSPEADRQKREQTEKVLFAGMFANLIVVFLIAYLFTKRITSRLAVLTDNTVRLKEGRELRPLIGGQDEIASVDAIFHDTAEALRQEMLVLKAGEEKIRSLIENLPIGLVLIDTKGSIELVNASIESTFKYASHQLLGKRLARLFAPGQPVIDGAPHSPQSQGSFNHNVELTGLDKDEQLIPVDFMMAEIQMEGESKTLAMIVDATEKHKIKKMRQEFVYMVRSELKEPLMKVSSFLTKFAEGSFGPMSLQGTTTTTAMQQNIDRLILLLNDLFDLEKLESGKIEIAPSTIKLESIFERSLNAVTMFAEKHQVKLEIPNSPIQIYADSDRLVQVIVNLLSNSIKFSPKNSIVSITVAETETDIEIGIVDRGPGIPPSQVDSIFEAYKQVEGQDVKKKGGTGLGLTICKNIIEAHGGTIGVTSELGKGSIFWFKLPRLSGEQL